MVVGELPFDPAVTEAMIRRRAVTETSSPLADTLATVWDRVQDMARAAEHGRKTLS